MRRNRLELERREAAETRSVSGLLEIRALSEEGEFEGYGSVFGVEDSYGDVVAAGAFRASLNQHKSSGTMPAMLWQHDTREPCGVWDEMREDDKGLYVKGRLHDTTRGRDVRILLKAKAVKGLSIGFRSLKWTFDEETDIRTVTELELWEVSPVTFPANPAAQITAVKGAGDIATERDLEKFLRDAGCSRTEARGIVSRVRESILARRDAGRAEAETIHPATLTSAQRLLAALNGA